MAYTLQQIFILPVTNPHGASISIHAPAKGATGQFHVYRMDGIVISIHAPVKGATMSL